MSRRSSVGRGDLEQVGQTALVTAPRDSLDREIGLAGVAPEVPLGGGRTLPDVAQSRGPSDFPPGSLDPVLSVVRALCSNAARLSRHKIPGSAPGRIRTCDPRIRRPTALSAVLNTKFPRHCVSNTARVIRCLEVAARPHFESPRT